MLSHELRNPLAPIRSAVHLLRTRERPGSEDIVQKQAHEIIERQVANLTKIVSDLLEVSRVLTGHIRLNMQVVDLNQIIRHAAETVYPLIEQRRHTLSLNLCGPPTWVSADPTRLEEILVNLLNNAAKYTPDGGQIGVWCEHASPANVARIRVRDSGVGISENYCRESLTCSHRASDHSIEPQGDWASVSRSPNGWWTCMAVPSGPTVRW